MKDRGYDLRYCPMFQQEMLYGDLNRIHGVTESNYIAGKGLYFNLKRAPPPVPVRPEDIRNLTMSLQNDIVHGKWKITELELNTTLSELCNTNFTDGSPTCDENFEYCKINVDVRGCSKTFNNEYECRNECETQQSEQCTSSKTKCAITFTAAITQMKKAGFKFDNVSSWLGPSNILTFNTFDKQIRTDVVSTLAILSK